LARQMGEARYGVPPLMARAELTKQLVNYTPE
jgi:hypothetical protein